MKNSKILVVSSLAVALAAAACFFLSESINISHIGKIFSALLMFVFGYLGMFFICSDIENAEKRKRCVKWTFAVFSLLYLVIFLDFTLIDTTAGRSISNIFSLSREEALKYAGSKTNLIPFKTVNLFVSALKNDTLSTADVAENILGNLFVLMPFTLFVPIAFSRMNKFCKFLIFSCALVISVELLQLVFMTGSADIDDFILNVSGALAAFGCLKIPLVKRLLSGFTFGLCGGKYAS